MNNVILLLNQQNGQIEAFSTVGGIFDKHSEDDIGMSIYKLYRQDLMQGVMTGGYEILKVKINRKRKHGKSDNRNRPGRG